MGCRQNTRVPFANVGLVKLPQDIDDDRAILLTGYFGAQIAEVSDGDTVAVQDPQNERFGCGPVGQFAILSASCSGPAASLPSIAFRIGLRWPASRVRR